MIYQQEKYKRRLESHLETQQANTKYLEGNRFSRRRSSILEGELQGGGRGWHHQQLVTEEEVTQCTREIAQREEQANITIGDAILMQADAE